MRQTIDRRRSSGTSPPPKPPGERERLAALRGYEILDTPPEQAFDDITRLAAQICGTPIAIVNFLDEDRQWFKAELGLGVRETPLDVSICAHAILQRGLFVVPDTLADRRFDKNPLVTGKPHLRFYAGALLETEADQALGTICVLDYEPRELTAAQKTALGALAKLVMAQLDLRRAVLARDRDIARRERAEAALRASEELARRALESSADCVTLIDREGRVTYVNPNGLFAMEIDELAAVQGESWLDLWPEPMREAVREAIAAGFDGRPARFEGFCPTAKGSPRWWAVTVTPVRGADDRVERLLAVSRDISDAREMETVLRRAKTRAEEATEAKSRMLAATSHDLRQPLTVLVGSLDMLGESANLGEEERRWIARAHRAAGHLDTGFRRLLEMSRLDAGLQPKRSDFSIGTLIGEIVDSFRESVRDKGIVLEIPAAIAADRVHSDPELLGIILQNLVGNAIKYTEGGRVWIDFAPRDRVLRVAVNDTGIGIAPDKLPEIFDEFRRVTPEHGTGMGLGLSIVRRTAELLGHPLDVNSEPGRGSSFAIELPLADSEEL